jgi:hypothetical protein
MRVESEKGRLKWLRDMGLTDRPSLATKVKKRFMANPAMPWDEAVAVEVERHA